MNFALAAPAVIAPGWTTTLTVWAHLARHLREVERRTLREFDQEGFRIQTKSGVKICRGAALTVRLHLAAFNSDDPEDDFTWDGEIANARFTVTPHPDASPGPYPGQVAVHLGGIRIAKLSFILEVGHQPGPPTLVPIQERRYRTAFASYASEDRSDVLARVQGMQQVHPQLDVFVDVLALRSGEHWIERLEQEIARRDIFYLFWSLAASRSPWVEKEWRTALDRRGIDDLDPVPLVSPHEVPPPPELASLHFFDWILAHIRGGL